MAISYAVKHTRIKSSDAVSIIRRRNYSMTSHMLDFSEPNRRILPSALSLSIFYIFISFHLSFRIVPLFSAIVPHRVIIGAKFIIIGDIIGGIPYDINLLHHYLEYGC